ncbi:MAG TPA: GIY-YIG nuclease family protein [Desulfuromonadales bacterium]|nr:GIY-YIG nuclease family protein [Desulfuromonadales bacterium]
MNWQVYIILCSDNTFYTGITTDVDRRLAQHAEQRGAKYFRGRSPLEVVYLESGHDRSSAARREIEIKGLSKLDKSALLASGINEVGATGRKTSKMKADE